MTASNAVTIISEDDPRCMLLVCDPRIDCAAGNISFGSSATTAAMPLNW